MGVGAETGLAVGDGTGSSAPHSARHITIVGYWLKYGSLGSRGSVHCSRPSQHDLNWPVPQASSLASVHSAGAGAGAGAGAVLRGRRRRAAPARVLEGGESLFWRFVDYLRVATRLTRDSPGARMHVCGRTNSESLTGAKLALIS